MALHLTLSGCHWHCSVVFNDYAFSLQVGPTATQAMQEFLTRLQVHLSSTCPQIFSELLLKLIHILSTER